jgi:Concanavalin A-like lectin/glucanases superfamily
MAPFTFNANLYRSTVLEDSPSLFWELNETSGTVANDISGGSNNGTINGGSTLDQAGPFGIAKSVQFNGSNAYIQRTYFSQNSDYAIELWWNPQSIGSTYLVAYNGNPGTTGYGLYVYSNQLIGLRGGLSFDYTGYVPTLNQWIYLVMARSSSTETIYVNGTSVLSGSGTSNTVDTAFAIAGASATAGYCPCFVSNVAFYSHNLSSARVAAHYAARLF